MAHVQELETIKQQHEGEIRDRVGSVAAHEAEKEELRRMLAAEQQAAAQKEDTIMELQQQVQEANGKTTDLESQMEALQVLIQLLLLPSI